MDILFADLFRLYTILTISIFILMALFFVSMHIFRKFTKICNIMESCIKASVVLILEVNFVYAVYSAFSNLFG